MSAINIITTPKAVHVISDGACYRSDGTLHGVAQKAHSIAHLRMIVAARGPSILTPLIAESLQHAFTSFDAAVEGMAAVVEDAVETYGTTLAMCSIGADFDLLVAGWSEARDCGETYYLSSMDRPGVPAWTVSKCGPVVISPNDDAMTARLQRQGAALDLNRRDPLDVALVIMEEQRKVKGHQGGDEEVHGVGAFAQVTSVTRDGIASRILRRWPDAIGMPLQPVPATHGEDGAKLLPWYGKTADAAPAPSLARPAISREQMRRLKQRRAS